MGIITPDQNPKVVDDFILRPGQAPVKFNEGDLILGGTELDGGQGGDITNKINNVSNNMSTTPRVQGQTGPIELTGTLTVKGEGENATVNVKRLLSQLSSGDLQNLSHDAIQRNSIKRSSILFIKKENGNTKQF